MKPFRFARASARKSGQDRWAAGSTTSSTCSRGASTRRAPSASMFEPPRSSARGWISRASRRLTSTRRWSVASSGGCRGDRPLTRPERPAVGGGKRRSSVGCTPVDAGSGGAPPAGRGPMRDRPVVAATFDDHLVHVQGLAVGTRRMYQRYAAAFLPSARRPRRPDWSRLTVPAIAAFVQTQAKPAQSLDPAGALSPPPERFCASSLPAV